MMTNPEPRGPIPPGEPRLVDESKFLRPGDFIEFRRHDGKMGVWEVRSVLLGGVGEESVYGIRTVDSLDPHDTWGTRVTEMYVPTVFLECLTGWNVVRRVSSGDDLGGGA